MDTAAMKPNRLSLPPLERLYEEPGLPRFDLPEALAVAYGGPIGFPTPRVCLSVTASLDGVAARPGARWPSSPQSDHSRFLTGFLRACADAVLVGGDLGHGSVAMRLSPGDAYPPAAPFYGQLRRLRGRPPRPRPVVLVTGDTTSPSDAAFADGALVLANAHRIASLRQRLAAPAALIELSESSTEPCEVVEQLRGRGYELILCEGCPAFIGAFLEAGVVDELFLTYVPLIVGDGSGPGRGETSLLLDQALSVRLLSLRRAGSQLFSRYELDNVSPARQQTSDEPRRRTRQRRNVRP